MNPETVLIVNGDRALGSMMAELVLEADHTCHTAFDTPTAVEVIGRETIDLAFTDISLPGSDGWKLMSELRRIMPRTSFIIITGYSEEYSYERIIGGGADDFLKKPFSRDEFRAKLRRLVGQFRLQAENIRLLKEQERLNERLATLLAVASDLTAELDVDRLFQLIVGKVTEAMGAERTSLYVIDWDKKELWTKVAEQVAEIRLPLGEGISGRVAETGELLNVADAWDLPYFNRGFDQKHQFRTKSVLCLPIRNQIGDRIGVLQAINKKNQDRFSQDDVVFIKGLASQVGVALENSLLHEELRLSFESAISALAATVDARHPLTAGHSQRVTEYALLIGREMGLSDKELEVLKYASLLHDIGKIGISDQVLMKYGRFTPEERQEMNTHPLKTKVILENFRFPRALQEVPLVAACHHEKIDGQGYPEGLAGEQLPLGSKIMAVADVFDALTSRRDYPKYFGEETLSSEPMPLAKAVTILKNEAGSHFEPQVVTAFNRCLPRALMLYRGNHFSPFYVDGLLLKLAPEMIL
ncbi:MAG: HD domain-containing phosphohydrolase [Thermodesulfobacteriota bacterium]